MARPGITREQVYEAAETLSREGQSPTVVAVRTRLGGGSPNNITRWLSEWKDLHESQQPDTIPQLPEAVETIMRQVWVAAWRDAQAQLGAERDALATARHAIDQERNQMFAEIERLDGDLEQVKEALRECTGALEQERRSHEQTRAEMREAKAIASEREKQINTQHAELRDIRREIQDSAALSSRLQADLQHAQRDLESAITEARTERKERQQLTLEMVRAQTIVTELKQQITRIESDKESAERHAGEARAIADHAGKKIQQLEQELAANQERPG